MRSMEKTSRAGAMLEGGAWRRMAGQPALHFVLLGSLLFVVSAFREPLSDEAVEAVADLTPIEIPSARIAEAVQTFRAERRRAPSDEERAELVETLIHGEILFRHALALGLQYAEVPQRRLAQIAGFVEPEAAAPDVAAADAGGPEISETAKDSCEAGSHVTAVDPDTAELARRAVELGLHEGDFVIRRVLIDAARRLVRGAGRLIEPSDEAVAEYLQANADRFREENRYRVSHALASQTMHGDPASVAAARLEGLRSNGGVDMEALPAGDPGLVPPRLPLLGVRAIERRFGKDFAHNLAELPVGEWAGPVASRHGAHLVFIHEIQLGSVPEVTEVADEVRAILREQAADRWESARLQQLREGRTIRVGDGEEVTS